MKCGIFTIEAFVRLLQTAGAALFIYAVLTSSALSESPRPTCSYPLLLHNLQG